MSKTKPRAQVGIMLFCGLLVTILLAAGCGTSTPQSASATEVPQTAAPSPTPEAIVTAAIAAVPAANLPVGVDAEGNFYRGDPNAPVKLVEFSDFQCPYCARHATQTGPLLDEAYVLTGKVVHYFRHFPLDFHPKAVPAAKAAICAGQQDARWFWEMHDWLFANVNLWAEAADTAVQLRAQALALGVDAARYDTCLDDPDTMAAIRRDQETGITMGVEGTPAFFINDWFVSGAQPYNEFQKVIEKALQGIHPPPTPTPLPPSVAPYDADPARPGLTYDGSPTLGAANARLVLIAFEDFKCGYCAQYFRDVEPILKSKYIEPGQLRVVFKFFPIYAPRAAVAALCASEQNRFWDFHDLLFAKQGEWQEGDQAAMAEFARELELDIDRFTRCLQEAPGQAQVEADYELGQQIGVRGTPYFLLLDVVQQTGLRIPGALPLEQFEEAIANLLNPATATPGP